MSGAVAKIDQLLNTMGEETDEKTSAAARDQRYVLDYFPIGGRAQPIRLAFYLQDIPYEDLFLGFSEMKTYQDEGKFEWWGTPNLAIYNSNNELISKLGQSNTILRYVARLNGGANGVNLYPTDDPLISARIDEICDAVEDLSQSFGPTMRIKDEKEKETKRKELWETRWSVLFEKFNGKLAKNNSSSGLFVGDNLTIADLKFYGGLKNFSSGNVDYISKDFIDEDRFSNLKTFLEKMESMPKIQEYFKDFQARAQAWKDKQAK